LLSAREAEVLQAIGDRLSNAKIASTLHISIRTVESHVSSLLRKLEAADRHELAELALRMVGDGTVAGLPAARTSFIGRDTEQASVLRALAGSQVVSLVGPGGVGKTRLAAKTAETVVTDYPFGAVFVDLVPVRDGFFAQALAALLGVTERPGRSLDTALYEYLGRGRSLLVLDNCEHLLGFVAAFVEKLLANCGDLTVLATSRERLAIPGERTVTVPPLSLVAGENNGAAQPEATTLFLDRARAIDPGFDADPAAVGEVCGRLDGVPLAIELAAARSVSLGVDGLLAGLDDRLRLLAGSRAPHERHRSLRAVLDWSHDLLDDDERALFRRAGAFVGGFDLAGAAAVAAGGDRVTAADLVGRLTDKSLLIHRRGPGGSRWQMLGTIRAYALDRLAASGEETAVREAHLSWAEFTAGELEGRLETGQEWRGAFDTVADDLRAALGHGAGPETGQASHDAGPKAGQAGHGAGSETGAASHAAGSAAAQASHDAGPKAGQAGHGAGSETGAASHAAGSAAAQASHDAGPKAGQAGHGAGSETGAASHAAGSAAAQASHDAGSGAREVGHRLARALGHLAYARRFIDESREHYEAAAARADGPDQAAADLRTAADAALAVGHNARSFELLLASAEKARVAGNDSARTIALAYAATIADRFPMNFPEEVPHGRLRELLDEAAATCPAGDPVGSAYVAAAAAWTAHPEKTVPDPALSDDALAAARLTGDPVLISGALDAVVNVLDASGRIREAHRMNAERAKLLSRLPRDDPRAGTEIVDTFHMVTAIAVTVGDLPGAVSSAEMAQGDDIAAGQPYIAAGKLIQPLVLQARFGEAHAQAAIMWEAWNLAGRPPARQMATAAYVMVLACGLVGDDDGHRQWLGRVHEVIGDGTEQVTGTSLDAAAAFTNARICLHEGRIDAALDAVAGLRPEEEDWYGVPHWHSMRPYAWAIAAEVAVVAGLPDAASRLAAAAPAGEENYWAAACLARAAGRLHGDRGALDLALAGWERIGARFERACTLLLIADRAAEGHDELRALGCTPPAS
jgi:predicted ATPase/DNA-binding CsgD family transcriptional regulator